jgi:hypothetical protein
VGTPVELKILEAVGVYGSDKAAAHHLAISVEWVERCLQSLRDKNGMATKALVWRYSAWLVRQEDKAA